MADVDRDALAREIARITTLDHDRARRIVDEFERTVSKPVLERLAGLRMKAIIRYKNPYLYRASGIETCEDIVRRAFQDYVSASLEGDFGKFFESVARIVSGGVKPGLGGEVDLDIRSGEVATLYAIKSGPKGFNSSSFAKARDDLNSAERRLRQDNVRTEKKVAFAYGRKKTSFKDGIERLASKDFWASVSGRDDFYRCLLSICAVLAPLYQADIEAPYQRLLDEAHELFCDESMVNWDRVLRLVSG